MTFFINLFIQHLMFINDYNIHVYVRNTTNNSNGTFGIWENEHWLFTTL